MLYDDDFDLDQPALMGVLGNEEVSKLHSWVNFNRHPRVVEQQSLQHTAFMKAEKSNGLLRAELKKAREDLALRTDEVEAAKKEVEDLRVEKEWVEKAGGPSAGMDKQVVAALVRKNLAHYQAKWDEEKAQLVDSGEEVPDWDEEGQY
ncbi:Restin-like protein-like Protein [Sesbania bispinosa]|nr:Restin-like protein-like Protein [Sesbania bispinosa]